MGKWKVIKKELEDGVYQWMDIRKLCTDMNGGNLVDGSVLAYFLYWSLQGKDKTKEDRTIIRKKIDGKIYNLIAKSATEIHLKVGIARPVYERALKRIVDRGFIKKWNFRWRAHSTSHIWIDKDVFSTQWAVAVENWEKEKKEYEKLIAKKPKKRTQKEGWQRAY